MPATSRARAPASRRCAYRANGVKVTVAEVLKANPGLNPNKLRVRQKIYIPDPSLK